MCNRTLCIVVVFVCLLTWSRADDDFMDDVQQQCIQQCPLQNRTDDAQFDCGYDCKIDQCTQGCKLWNRALESSCKTVCNGTQDIVLLKELYCVMGCNDAMTRYFSLLRERIGTPPAPALVADSLTATSLSLKWDFASSGGGGGVNYAGVRYLVQWRYEELSAEWQYCRNKTWGSQDVVFVDNLQPYTKYRFRVALLLSHHHGDPIVSEPSVVISTLASGTPASPPAIVRAVPVDWSRISVSWEPGPFPHGPVLSYVLHISENHPHGYSALKDIPATGSNFYMFQNLAPSTNYSVSVTMRNGVGEGPAANVLVSTPEEPEVVDTGKPILILAGYHTVIQQGEDLLDEPIVIYKTRQFIKGLAIHVRRQLLFISDSAGYIYKTYLEPRSNRTVILTPQNLKFHPLDLSIDWLNEQLYILGEVAHSSKSKVWQITRCNLDGSGLTVAVAGLLTKPHHVEVDPYNGYLFWVIDGTTSRAGLYRLDLADISNGVKHEVRPDIILERPHLGAFAVDHTKFHLLVPDHSNNTVYSVSFDGRELHDVRNNTQQPMFLNVLSISTANGLFYWTNGDQVLKEEHYQVQDSYYHNAYPALIGQSYTTVVVNLPSSQPIPVPVNPPTAVQAILGSTLAKTSWQVPHLLGGQGKGAWQNWSYEINIKDLTHSKTFSHKGINATSYTIRNLRENTEYVVKTAAYTSSGTGPWSSEFRGKTLRRPVYEKFPAIIWSAYEGVLTSDVTGENVQSLIHKSHMKDYFITDIAWYQNQLYLVSNTSHMYWYNMTNHKSGKFVDIDSVGSVAVDWIGKKLYWSNPKQQLIIRGNLNGTQQEPLPILTVAKELNIDSVNAYIYWSTGHAVECARLNGVDRLVYHPAQLFSGKQVMGLTLDMEKQMVYWIVRSYEGSTLFREKMAQHLPAGTSPSPIRVSNLQKPNMQGPLCYFSDHLLWLQDDKNAVIGDMNGQNTAIISGMSLSGLTMVSVMDPLVHELPGNRNKIVNVIPEAISPNSVKVFGKWDAFNITWLPTNNTDYGKLFYEVKINDGSKKDTTRVTTTPYIKYWKPVPPYTKLDVAIRAYTYWGSAPQVRIQLYSPSSTPSAPKNARCYVTYKRRPFTNNEIAVLFRWDTPEHANGVINGFIVKCWYKEEMEDVYLCQDTIVEAKHLQYVIKNLTENETYYFQVQAFTHIGNGVNSDVIRCDTSEELPVPVLLASSTDSIFIQDFDTHKNYSILRNTIQPIDISYLYHENKIFWLNELQELYMSDIDGGNKTKLLSITGRGSSISMDWVERCLYYVQSETLGSSVHKLDLNKIGKGSVTPENVLSIPHTIVSFEVSPFTRKFYWIEINQNQKHVLMQANVDDSKNVEIFFGRNRLSYKRAPNSEYLPCNCPDHENIDRIFAVDHSDVHNRPKIIFIDPNTQEIISADMHGCLCNPVVERNLVSDSFPIYSLTADKNNVYWSNGTNGVVYSINKNDNLVVIEKMNGHNFMTLSSQMQPFPAGKCLTPKETLYQVSFNSKTADSITLNMPQVIKNDGCEDISLASVEFIIYYMPYNEGDILECDETCSKQTTFEKTMKITGLRPFSKYMFSVAIKNYYSGLQNVDEFISPSIVFQTAAGAPTKPQDVTTTVLNPTMVEVKWLPPQELNGETVWYEIHSLTEVRSVRQKGEQRVSEENSSNSNEKYKIADLQKLFPNQTYLIWVRAYSENNETYTDSDSVQIQTYPEPNDIILINSTAYSMEVFWKMSQNIEHCTLQYTDVISHQWKDIVRDSTYDNITAIIRDLKPKMKYRFRLSLKYVKYSEAYIWPSDTRFIFETLGDRPSPPGMPIIGQKGDIYQVSWEASKDNGAPIEMYNLEGRGYRNYRIKRNTNRTAYSYIAPSVEEYEENEWCSFYNGTDTYWTISGLNRSYQYYFRVSALNIYGWSDPSKESNDFNLNAPPHKAEKHEQMGLILGISVPLLATICVCSIICFIYLLRRKDKEKKSAQAMLANRPISPDVELATLRELPRRNNFVHNTNALYVSALPSAEELALLPQINRDQITLINFLGRGAFGEVYEGKAKKIGANGTDMKVAVKTLRKGATEQEKIEFLQEAQLMSHFKHEHILQLLGVCLDTHFIIMELMEGGDLLTYLRSNRKPQASTDALTILDLLSMCVDVARGCRYLEEMHFVHRDLACRNCLVSSTDRQARVVKIGDFGLARDIYKNDYYRKEGEGLLPVRWMAPESLVDGVFTCQSDVWAFGVLMWEIMTLGQQPYPARNNLEVLHYVKGGGRLEKPNHSPEELHKLMMDCWSYQQNSRPTFKYCLEVLEQLKNSTTDGPLTAVHSGNYISTVPNAPYGVSNHAYFQDENHNSSVTIFIIAGARSGFLADRRNENPKSLMRRQIANVMKRRLNGQRNIRIGSSWKTDNGDDTNRDQVPLVQPANYKTLSNGHVPNSQSSGEIPKYLEIICDSCDPPFNDGYEIPRSSIRSNKSVKLEDRARTFSTSSTISNGSVASNKNVSGKNGVQKTIVSSLKDKLLPPVQSNGESCNHKENVRLDCNFDV